MYIVCLKLAQFPKSIPKIPSLVWEKNARTGVCIGCIGENKENSRVSCILNLKYKNSLKLDLKSLNLFENSPVS